jgi:microcystin-dependent protein
MADPYIGEIRSVGFNFAPVGWAFCDGSLLAIADYEALFDLLGTTYGGDGRTTFALPDLRGRVPLHQGSAGGNSYSIGMAEGAEMVALTEAQMPTHTHTIRAFSTSGNSTTPSGTYIAASAEEEFAGSANATLASSVVQSAVGGSQAHENRVPYLCINFIISLFGVFPSQS